MFLSQVSSSLLNAYVLGSFAQLAYLFLVSTGISLLSTLSMALFLPEVNAGAPPAPTQKNGGPTMWSMMQERRMVQVYGLLLGQALSLAIRQGGMVPFISHTIQGADVQEQFKLASLASAMFGIGQLVGSPLVGYVNDHLGGGRPVARTLLVIHLVAYSVTLVYNEVHTFGWLAFAVTFFFGVQDAALQTQVTIVLGFEFRTNTEPFAIYRLLNSLAISATMAAQSFLDSLPLYRYFFSACFLATMAAQSVMGFIFQFQNRKTQRATQELTGPQDNQQEL
jgi:predicted MFS family arabinose efflux permease